MLRLALRSALLGFALLWVSPLFSRAQEAALTPYATPYDAAIAIFRVAQNADTAYQILLVPGSNPKNPASAYPPEARAALASWNEMAKRPGADQDLALEYYNPIVTKSQAAIELLMKAAVHYELYRVTTREQAKQHNKIARQFNDEAHKLVLEASALVAEANKLRIKSGDQKTLTGDARVNKPGYQPPVGPVDYPKPTPIPPTFPGGAKGSLLDWDQYSRARAAAFQNVQNAAIASPDFKVNLDRLTCVLDYTSYPDRIVVHGVNAGSGNAAFDAWVVDQVGKLTPPPFPQGTTRTESTRGTVTIGYHRGSSYHQEPIEQR